MTKYRKVAQCPPRFERFLKVIRAVAEYELPPIGNLEKAQGLLEQLKQFKELFAYITETSDKTLSEDQELYLETCFDNYSCFYLEREKLKLMMRNLESKRRNGTLPKDKPGILFTLSRSVPYFLYPSGELKARPIVDWTTSINTKRLQKCEICHHIFWAKKSNAKTCGLKQCANVLAQRNYQKKNKEDLKKQRQERKEMLKSGKAKVTRSKKNGTL